MTKILAKKKKLVKKQILTSDVTNVNNEVPVLGVVRDINLDNLERAQNTEIVNLIKDDEYFGSECLAIKNHDEKGLISQKSGWKDAAITIGMPSPKRKRSIMQRSHSKSAKGQREIPCSHSFKMDEKPLLSFGQESYMNTDMVGSVDSDLLVSCLPTIKSISSRNGNKDAGGSHNGEAISNDTKKYSISVDSNERIGNSRSLKGSVRKRKIRSIAVLAKVTIERAEKGEVTWR